jgi:serine/threonine-protein phosphatase 2A regulatory subunit B
MLAYSSSKGTIRLIDLRQSALCDNHSKMLVIPLYLLSVTFYPSVLENTGDFYEALECVQLSVLQKIC